VSKTVVAIPASAAGTTTPGISYRYTLSPACPLAKPFDATLCAGASSYCASIGKAGFHEYVWRTDELSDFKQWLIVGDICSGGLGDPVSEQQVVDGVSEYERVHVPIPKPNVQPGTYTLVNLPVLVSVTDPGEQVMSVQQPVPGQLVATPTFSWTFDDGTILKGVGRPYTDGVDPRYDKAGYYLSHTYRESRAHASVTLVVTWHATFAAAGQTFDLPDLRMPGITTTFEVDEAHAVLVGG
jgi:hypothetical protein